MAHFRKRYLAVPTSAAKARAAISAFAASHGYSGDALCDIETSVGEAVANAIEHGNRMRGAFSVQAAFASGMLTIEITDGGAGFDDSTKPVVDIATRRVPSLRGYGLYLMRTLMSRVTFRDNGTTIVLEKRLPDTAGASQQARRRP